VISDQPTLQPGLRVIHPEYGDGVVVAVAADGSARAFFTVGERQVPAGSLRPLLSATERVVGNVGGSAERLRRVHLTCEAHTLPLLEGAATLTAAKVDLLPHQIVLTHRIATASPRRFLIADEVGLGKTIETALLLRELASRGELQRALMIVPAGLVNNWHRELNEVFNLGFEVFGSQGDVTDRKTNAFLKHDRLIASIDSLKRPQRVKRLLEAPPWDLLVFDEAHHLTAYRNGRKVTKTDNYRLAEAVKQHTRDLLLLSATPHQGDHFRFWMLIQLLNPTLFQDPDDMVANRHRLNAIVFRRTKADACRADGSALFARRWVHTESFVMDPAESRFYDELRRYLEDGYAIAKTRGNEGRALGFVMAIFQKIAASSFWAVRRTLRRRLLNLLVYEAVLRDRELDIEGRQKLLEEARELIRSEYGLGDDRLGRNEIDRVLAELKVRVARKLEAAELERVADPYGAEYASTHAEDVAAATVSLALPEERQRIRSVLDCFPSQRETKVSKLLHALGELWRQNPNEKVVVFATYLGTVDLLAREIEAVYPGQGVAVLRGGDHGAKVAAERKFRKKDGPRVLVCTAAGREGINLQFARVLFNFDLPWNPMDVEQRIGRIHRYGQEHTAQIYNLVLSDTIEGRIFLLLRDKLVEIARAVGRVDENGEVAEDLRAQVLGQLSERLSYDRLYLEALSDPELRRTKLEVESALSNADEARQVVFELFQDLDRFSLEDYRPLADTGAALNRLRSFLVQALADRREHLVALDSDIYEVREHDGSLVARLTTDRETAQERDDLSLLGLDLPLVQRELLRWQETPPEERGASVRFDGDPSAVLTVWLVEALNARGQRRSTIQCIAIDLDGQRLPTLEEQLEVVLRSGPVKPFLSSSQRLDLVRLYVEPTLAREVEHRGLSGKEGGFSAELLGWLELWGGDEA
jgi:superfamily II DNA or RNA helicase